MDYASWCALSDEELARRDIAEVNLAAAAGLPFADNLDITALCRKLDEWAKIVGRATLRAVQRRRLGDYPELSHNQFRMAVLVSVLRGELGVTYDLKSIEGEFNAYDSRPRFIHGMLQGGGGTCVSMPVLYTAIGRRLGYPLRLALAKEHMFCRWRGSDEVFNIEATSPGYNSRTDEEYLTWPKPICQQELRETGWYLRDLSPREELAYFLGTRGYCFLEHFQFALAIESFYHAVRLERRPPPSYGCWCKASILQQMLEDSHQLQQDVPGFTRLFWREPQSEWERHFQPQAQDEFRRLVRNQERRRSSQRPIPRWVENARRYGNNDPYMAEIIWSNW